MVVILHTKPLLSSIILGTKIEGFIILVLITFWTALVAIVSDTRHGLATDSSGSIANGNLYYFSWAGLATGVSLFSSFLRSKFGFDLGGELRSRAERLQQWVWAGERWTVCYLLFICVSSFRHLIFIFVRYAGFGTDGK